MTTGHERDKETGLDYRGARFYDSDVARFLSLDPLAADFPEWSAYNYVLGNPVMLVDPDGKAPEPPKMTNEYTTVARATRINSSKTVIAVHKSETMTRTETRNGKTIKTTVNVNSTETATFNDKGEYVEGTYSSVLLSTTSTAIDGKVVPLKYHHKFIESTDFNGAGTIIKQTQKIMKGIHKAGIEGNEADESSGNIIIIGNNDLDPKGVLNNTSKVMTMATSLAKYGSPQGRAMTIISGALRTINSASINGGWNLSNSTLLLSEDYSSGNPIENKGPYGNTTQSYNSTARPLKREGALLQKDVLQYEDE